MKKNAKIVVMDSNVFCISDDKILMEVKMESVTLVPAKAYELVVKFITEHNIKRPKEGWDWEFGPHNKIVNILKKQSGFLKRDISNALCACGIYKL